MNLSALKFFRSLRATNRQFVVIGLGRFGRAVSSTLHSMGYEVLGIDNDEKRVDQALSDEIASHVLQLDAMQPSALREAGVFEFDTVIVAIGNYIQESIITTLNLKEGKVPHIVAKASSEIHGKLLERVGADHVVFPEHEMGCELARSLTRPGILDRFEVDPNHSIVELVVPQEFDNKSIRELDLRPRYGLNVIAVCHEDQVSVINPDPETILKKDMVLVVVGLNKGIDKLPV